MSRITHIGRCIAVVAIVGMLGGCGGQRTARTTELPAPAPSAGAATPTATMPAIAAVPASIPPVSSPMIPRLLDPRPADATLSSGATTQTGAHGYATWCDDTTMMGRRYAIIEQFARVPLPAGAVRVARDGEMIFQYTGMVPLREVRATWSDNAIAPTPAVRTGTVVATAAPSRSVEVSGTMQSAQRAILTARFPPGEYTVRVRATVETGPAMGTPENCAADFIFRVIVEG